MTRYFFDIRDGDEFIVDQEGMELPHVEAARLKRRTPLPAWSATRSTASLFL